MKEQKTLSEKESLELITSMIEKVKSSYHETGIVALLWGSVVAIVSLVNYLEIEFSFELGFDIWLLVLFALIPHVIISMKERRLKKVRKHEDDALDAVWLAYGISIFGLVAYENIVPSVAGSSIPSIYSLFLLLYALPTLVTGLVKKFRPMLIGAILTYGLFIASCFTVTKYDMLFGAVAALTCWFIPGLILRKRYLEQRRAHV
ncbi:hypothetical protein [Asinibacterium sp. OR53]|uniref:hypothetical protein n=1 Tax=Asinibacterium sp. OR53 TaxID=925409 RepID=UPI0004793129|nr:hypothetical protein [Asinibacterium sp. OR53]